jgi:hypothetical protein
MFIDAVFPAAVGAKDKLLRRLIILARSQRLSDFDRLVGPVPVRLLNARCFFDRMTRRWRYEYGLPLHLDATRQQLWGTHMWLPVRTLLKVLVCARSRMLADQYAAYCARLASESKHHDALSEMAPILHIPYGTPARFEVPGLGKGNHTIDWHIQKPGTRPILLDVKRRIFDLVKQMDQPLHGTVAPDHDASMLFRSVEDKLLTVDRRSTLQGTWIHTEIKQEECALQAAFAALDPGKVHFAILGDFERNVHVLSHVPEESEEILETLALARSTRFTFRGG